MTDKTKPNSSAFARLPDVFHQFAHKASVVVGSPWAFVLAIVIIAV